MSNVPEYGQFLARFGASLDNTEGYTVAELKAINAAAWDECRNLDLDAYGTADIVQNVYERLFTQLWQVV